MSHPALESQPLVGGDGGVGVSAAQIKRNFLKMTVLFAINHGCIVSCLDLANARLGSIGVWQSGLLYASYTTSALFGASYFTKKYGSRNGLILGMGMIASYVTSFFFLSFIVEKEGQFGRLHALLVGVSAIVGGIGSSNLWVSQGAYFSGAAQLYASKEGGLVEDATSQFGGNFAFVFLLFEVLLRLMSTFLIKIAGLSWRIIFGMYALLAILPVMAMVSVMEPERYSTSRQNSRDGGFQAENGSPTHKAAATFHFLRRDPIAKYLSPLPILFGLSAAFSSAVANGVFIREVFSDPNTTYVGFFTATSSMVASGASLLFGRLQIYCGKGPIMMVGVLSYLAIAMQFMFLPGRDWSTITLVLVYIWLGVGRATYESTLRSIFADLFPDEKEGAFGSIVLFSGGASTVGYLLSVTGALECSETSRYCKEYRDGSIHNVFVMESMIIICAAIAIPSLWRALRMSRQE